MKHYKKIDICCHEQINWHSILDLLKLFADCGVCMFEFPDCCCPVAGAIGAGVLGGDLTICCGLALFVLMSFFINQSGMLLPEFVLESFEIAFWLAPDVAKEPKIGDVGVGKACDAEMTNTK